MWSVTETSLAAAKWVVAGLLVCAQPGAPATLTSPSAHSCPRPCEDATSASSWTAYDDASSLQSCDQQMLLDFGLDSGEVVSSGAMAVRACTLNKRADNQQGLVSRADTAFDTSTLCVSDAALAEVTLDVAMAGDGANMTYVTADSIAQVASYMSADCNMKQSFSYGLGAVVGVYSGAAIDNGGTVPFILAEALALANNSETGAPASMFVQRCPEEGTSKHIFGVAVNNDGDFDWVQSAIESWSSGVCLNASSLSSPQVSTIFNITLYEYSHPAVNLSTIVPTNITSSVSDSDSTTLITSSTSVSTTAVGTTTVGTTTSADSVTPPGPTQTGIISTCNAYALPEDGSGCWDFANSNGITLDELYAWNPAIGECENFWLGEAYCVAVSGSAKRAQGARIGSAALNIRTDCSTIKVVSGDSCDLLASRCGISGDDFTKYNDDICSTLVPGQRVCCSEGTLPDITPKPNSDGSCYSYTVQKDESCSTIGAEYGMTNEKIEEYNNGTTWGWFGCQKLPALLTICLSEGDPPLPNAVDNAQCGPTVPGTVAPTNGTAISDLNPCPLNACCNIWGQCGITPAYCTNNTGPAGNPGTAPENENGCVSNCGTDIVNNFEGPSEFISIGYYESWNWDRACLNMRAASIDSSKYTHVHWAFATVDDGFGVVINDSYSQWKDFKALPVKRIISFGGWGYSTEPATYDRLREAMSGGNRDTFVSNIVSYVKDENLDGVDFDWEYPGAPDIPGIPAGLATDGTNYLAFLTALRKALPSGKSMSFAAPASYWYLKQFPISDMAEHVDYIVYMTYDLHGQWDWGNKWAQDGCESGACLQSHVNLTETMLTLAMITKAGVPTYQIAVGISSYGRSFKMAEAGCTGPLCTFTANADNSSQAMPGECTVTPGYISNAEILDILSANVSSGVQSWYDEKTDSNYAVWDDTEWVAYMTDEVKESRKTLWKNQDFAGTVDWAIDLAEFTGDDGAADGTCDDDDEGIDDCPDDQTPEHPYEPCDSPPTGHFDDLTDETISGWRTECAAQYTLVALKSLLDEAMDNYTAIMNDHYDDKFKVYAKAVAGSANGQFHDFMQEHGNDYFTCEVVEISMCCSYCHDCKYCFDGDCYTNRRRDLTGIEGPPEEGADDISEDEFFNSYNASHSALQLRGDYYPGWNRKLVTSFEKKSEPCPPDYSERGYGPTNPYEQSVYWTLQDDKADDFYADLLDETGVPKDKVGFGLHTNIDTCGGTGHKVGDGDDCWNIGYEFAAPYPKNYEADDVSNPKTVAEAGLSNSADLPGQIDDVINQMQVESYLGDGFDVVDAVGLPIMMIVQGVESMSMVVQTADKIEEEERKALILAFVSAILFFVPIAGEVLGAVAEVADIAAIISVLGAIGNAALDVYTIVDDPDNAPLAIVGLIMAPLALADVATVAKAASIRRGMSATDVAKLGERVSTRMDKLKAVTGTCKA
ncbi:putative chitinase [Seiridium unicorne]|uniref:chitinase n=1 Tax=Seiridium unicorne TaxID=138068 RepID=A0ABR2ULA5_9PEZI